MYSTQSFPLSEEVVHLLFNSTVYRSELVMYGKAENDTEANILWILDMRYVMLNYSGTCWITLTTLMEAGFPHVFIWIFPVHFQDFSWSQLRFCKGLPANLLNEVP